MEYLPVGKRTRSQRAKMLMEQNKRARLAAKREWKKKKEENFEGKVGIKDEILEEGSEAMVIDEEEFLKGVKFNESEKNSQIQDLGIVKKEVSDYDDDDDDDGDDGNGVMMFDNNVNDGESDDDSLQILGEKWNPLGLDDAYDDDDDGDGDGDGDGKDVHDDGCHPLAVEISSDDNDDDERDGVKKGEYCKVKDDDDDDDGNDDDGDDDDGSDEDDDDGEDDDFLGNDDESSSSSDESSSSACSVIEVDEDDNVLLNDDGDDDDEDDDDIGVSKLSHKNEKRENFYVNDEKLFHYNKIKVKFFENELKKKVSIEKEAEEVEVEKVIVEKRKRGRPRKNKSSAKAEVESSQSKIKVRKATKEKELQKIILNSILEGECKRIEENLADSTDFYLPLKFKFGVDKLVVHEKSEDQLEVDKLFKELDFSLQASNICATSEYDYDGDSEDVPSKDGISQEELCVKGEHFLILDDEIGLICKFCSYVNLEIRHVMPDFNKNPFRRENRRDYERCQNEAGDGFQIPDSASNEREGDHLSPAADDVQGTVWDLVPGVKRGLYHHQREGFEFIWKNIAGGIKIDELGKAAASTLGGCVIRHDPGSGKTRLATVFLHSFMKLYEMANPLVLAPYSVLYSWEKEFAEWKVDIPFFNLNEDCLSGKEDPKFLTQAGYTRNIETIRSIKLSTWASGKGVLGASYQLFRELAGEEKKGRTSDKIREILLKKPGVIVMDEGHIARNDNSKLWNVLTQTSTKRRVILSGTPFQNNFEELHNTLSLVRENIGTPVLSAYYEQDERRIEELKKKIEPFVHSHKKGMLGTKLKGIFHSRIILKPSNLQERCFQHLPRVNTSFTRDYLVAITSVHPSILCYGKVKKTSTINDDALMDVLEKHKTDLDAGVKIRFLVELIKMSKGERVIVFGQYLQPLEFIADLLDAAFGWNVGSELLYIHGKLGMRERQSMIQHFNDPKSEARVLLASTKACSEGIHLVGGSRVVLLDVVWNPSVERQAISRAYRIGQEKEVYVYHLISGSLEENKYQKQASKERQSELIFSSEESIEDMCTNSKISEDRLLEEMIHHQKMKHLFVDIINNQNLMN